MNHAARKTALLARLAILRQAPSLEDTDLELYGEELSGVSVDVLASACQTLARTPRGEGESAFPSLGVILDACLEAKGDIEREQVRLLAAQRKPDDEPTYFCPTCRDEPNGWREYRCEAHQCGRKQPHLPHPYVERCICFGRNPVIAAERAKNFRARTENA